jgi:LytS/YehU family sensor histidine kinase
MKMEGKTLVFESSNQCLPRNDGDRNGSGIGLQNIKKRLQLIYPGAYSFNAGAYDGVYSARLEIENIL